MPTDQTTSYFPQPRIYRMRPSRRIVGIILVLVGILLVVVIWGGVITGATKPSFIRMMVPILWTIVAGLFAISTIRAQVRVSDTEIEQRTLRRRHTLPFDKIRGRRRYVSRGGEDSPEVRHLVLEPNDDRFPKLDIEEFYGFDERFYQWFNSLPNLDEVDNSKTTAKASNFGLV
jgi:hypothetical protein